MNDARLISLGLLAALALGATLALQVRRLWKARRLRRRMARATWGEKRAERLLAAQGYKLEARQLPARVGVWLDEVRVDVDVRVDLIVRRAGRRYAAEVKTGARAPHIDHAPTRRQLLEYAHAYDVDGVLLVDAEAGTVREVRFEAVARRASRSHGALGWALALGWAMGMGLAVLLGWAALHIVPGPIGSTVVICAP